MKLEIVDKQSGEPALVLDQNEHGLSVVGGDARLVQALKLNQFKDLKEIADFINSDPNGPYVAQEAQEDQQQEEQQPDQQQETDERIKPALQVLKEAMARVKNRQDQENSAKEAKNNEGVALRTTDSQIQMKQSEMIYVSFDGDNIGNAVARAERKDDEKVLAEISTRINAGQDVFREWAQTNGGMIIEQGGDEGLCKVPGKAFDMIEAFRKQYEQTVKATCSVGVGKKISEATDARMLAKLKGKNRTETFDEITRKELKLKLEQKGDAESKKISDALEISPTGPQEVHEPEPQEQEAPPEEQSAQAEQQASEQDSEPTDQVSADMSPELIKAMQAQLKKQEPQPDSIMDSVQHDENIEKADYSDSDSPQFAKSLRYLAKYGVSK
jgi:hypothetical protein